MIPPVPPQLSVHSPPCYIHWPQFKISLKSFYVFHPVNQPQRHKINVMEKNLRTPISILHISKTSLLTVIGMISYFFLMKLLHLDLILELRFVNFLFIFFGVRHVLLHKQSVDGSKIKFHPAMMIGFITVFFTAALFSTFIFVYLSFDPSFLTMIRFSQPFGHYLSPASCAMVTFLEGVASGAIVAIPVLRTMKRENARLASEPISQLAN